MNTRSALKNRRRSGSIILWLGVSLVFLIPIVGLAIDVGIAYAVKARLSGAVDAAALAGAQSFSFAQSLAAQKQRAEDAANAYFAANFPAGSMGTSNASFTAPATPTTTTINVVMSGALDAPLFFLRSLGVSNVRVAASGTAQRQIANIMLVLDRSGSLQQSNSCQAMVSAAQTFTTYFATGQDQLGMIAFGGSYQLAYPMTLNFNVNTSSSLFTKIGTITSCSGTTGTAQALWMAYRQIQAVNQPGALNAIVLFTDGIPNGVTADWPVKRLATPSRGNYTTASPNSITYPETAASTCNATAWNTIRGNVAYEEGIYGWKTNTINTDAGLIANNSSANEPEAVSPAVANPGNNWDSTCAFRISGAKYVYKDLAYIPAKDIYGNDTTGSQGATIGSVPATLLLSTDPYYPNLDPSWKNSSQNAIDNAATNAVYAAANRIRSDAVLHPVIYTIGFGASNGINTDANNLLLAVANDPASPYHNASQQTGKYKYVADATELQRAFADIATVLLRLSK